MTIAQALKEKNKKIAGIQKIWEKINRYNSIQEGAERPYSTKDLYLQAEKELTGLVELKTRIHSASEPVRSLIFELSELKAFVQRVRSVSTTNGTWRERYENISVLMNAELDILWQDAKVEEIENKIELIQEKLDKFNHTTEI
jgi:DNA repair ATPase RecN